jgi:hypothetical protein
MITEKSSQLTQKEEGMDIMSNTQVSVLESLWKKSFAEDDFDQIIGNNVKHDLIEKSRDTIKPRIAAVVKSTGEYSRHTIISY